MITQVELENFQAHKHLVLEMGEFTTLTGASNSGKSSVLRALGALLKNESAGHYITYGQKVLVVKVTTDTGVVVEWRKGSGENSYIIHRPDGSKQEFQKVGTDVPEEVGQALKITPIVMEGGQKLHVNFHGQLESPFLIGETAGYAAKVFGELTSASKIYAAVSEGNRHIRSNLALKKTRRADYDALIERKKAFEGLDSQKVIISEIKDLFVKATKIGTSIKSLGTLTLAKASTEGTIHSLEHFIDQASSVEEVEFTSVEALDRKINRLLQLQKAYVDCENKVEKLSPVITAFQNAVDVDIDTIVPSVGKYTRLSTIKDSLSFASMSVTSKENDVEAAASEYDACEEELSAAYSNLDSCPSCGQELSDGAKEHLLGEQLV